MTEAWQKSRLGDLCSLRTGGTPSKATAEYFGGNIRWLVSGDVNQGEIFDCEGRITEAGMKASNAKVLPVNSVMIALNGQGKTRGAVAMLRTQATCNQSLVCIYPHSQDVLMSKFLYLFLQSRYQELRQMTGDGGNDRRGLTMGLIRNIEIPVPSPWVQQRIVATLDEALQANAQARANAGENLHNSGRLFGAYLNRVFAHRSADWPKRPFGTVASFVRGPFGASLKKSMFVNDGFAVYEQSHAIGDQFSDIRYFIDEAKFSALRRFEVLPNDIIMSCAGTMGRTAIVPEGTRPGVINQALLKLTPGPEVFAPYLKYWMESHDFQAALTADAAGAAIQNVASVKVLKDIRVPVPPLFEQHDVVRVLGVVGAETGCIKVIARRKLAALDELKQSLLHQAFSGAL